MKTAFFTLIALLFSFQNFAQVDSLYTKDYGNPQFRTLIFLHDGPGGNSAEFEAKMVPLLLNMKYHIIVYDRRGEGRSSDLSATHTKDEWVSDFKILIEKYRFTEASLLADGYGAVVAKYITESLTQIVSSVHLLNPKKNLEENALKNLETISRSQEDPQFPQYRNEYKKLMSANPNSFTYLANIYAINRKLECAPEGKILGHFKLTDAEKNDVVKSKGNLANLESWICKTHFNTLENDEANPDIAQFELISAIEAMSKNHTQVTLMFNVQEIGYNQQDAELMKEKLSKCKIKVFDSKAHDLIAVSSPEIAKFIFESN